MRAEAALERAREAEHARGQSQRLEGLLASALSRFGGVEPLEPPLVPDPAAVRQRSVLCGPAGKVSRAELAATLNETNDPRIAAHIARSREHVAELEREEARESSSSAAEPANATRSHLPAAGLQKLAPHRRGERPVAKADTPQTRIHREARVMMAAIVNSRGSYVIQSYLYKLRGIFSGQPLAALRAAALDPMIGGFRWTYADECARRRVAIGLMWLCCGKWTNQRTAFGSRSTRRGLVITGLSVDRILRAATPVGRRPYDRHTFSSRSSRSSPWRGDMAHFERAGFAIRKRLPPSRVNSWEIGPSGQAKNRYWIGCVVSNRDPKREQRNRAVTPLGAALGGALLDPSAHHIGWEWASEVPTYAGKLEAPS